MCSSDLLICDYFFHIANVHACILKGANRHDLAKLVAPTFDLGEKRAVLFPQCGEGGKLDGFVA